MAVMELMTWSKSDKRWHKGHKGKRYAVSPKQLGCPPSREHSREAANAWWAAKQGKLETSPPPKPHEADYRRVINFRRRMAQWFRDHLAQDPIHQRGMDDAEREANRLQAILDNEESPPALTCYDEPLFGISQAGVMIWTDRFKHDRKDPAPKERSIKYWVERWIENQRARANAKEIATDRFSSYRYALSYFQQWAGCDNDVATITSDRVEQYYNHLLDLITERENDPDGEAGCARAYAKARLDACKQFCQWLDEKDLVPLPKNIRNRKALRIKLGNGKRETYPVQDIKTILDDAETPDRMKLFVLLMLNTGAYQVDVARLNRAQVNLKTGRIERKRSKTESHPNVPTVNYLLWKRTATLLGKFLNTDKTSPLALLNEKGQPLQSKWIGDDGRAKKVCNITTAYKRLKTRLGLKHSLGQLRKTSSNLLYNNKTYRPLHVLFLGHSPRTVAERFYVNDDPKTLDAAIRWLGQQLGIK
jgi:integrase